MYNFKSDSLLTVAANQKKKEKDYWLELFSGDWEKVSFPYDDIVADPGTCKLKSLHFLIKENLSSILADMSKGFNERLFIILIAELLILLCKYSGKNDLTIGFPVVKQDANAIFFNSFLVLRKDIRDFISFKNFLNEVGKGVITAVDNQNFPIKILPDMLGLTPGSGEWPLFDVAVLLNNIHDIRYLHEAGPNITFAFEMKDNIITGFVEYNSLVYKGSTIKRLIDHFNSLLEKTVGDRDIRIADIDMLTEEERKKILIDFNDTDGSYPEDTTVHELLDGRADAFPDYTAVVYQDKKVTYRELKDKTDGIAALLGQRGVKPDDIIALLFDNCIEMIISILGIIKSRGAYLPIDPQYPLERINYILRESCSRYLISTTGQAETLHNCSGDVLFYQELDNCHGHFSGTYGGIRNIGPHHLAYIIYTSGSTGKPKGVMINHRSFVDFSIWAVKEFEHRPGYQVLLSNSSAFDGSIQQIFPPLISGGTLHLIDKNTRLDISAYIAYLKDNKINNIDEVPALMAEILNQGEGGKNSELLPDLTCLCLGSEYVPIELVRRCRRYLNHQGRIINAYGPAEASVETTTYHFDGNSKEEISLIGKPRRNTKVYIVNKTGNLCPVGIQGEICISGIGLARGYLNKPGLTAEKFLTINHRGIGSARLYKSGDQGCWLPDGNIKFLGRMDSQVSIRGFRVELGEIENQLKKTKVVKEAVVIAKQGENGDNYLCAYVIGAKTNCIRQKQGGGRKTGNISSSKLKDVLAKRLPQYMIPSYVVWLDRLPLTPNGKVDKQALPEPEMTAGEDYLPPRNEMEKKLADIWSRVLKVNRDAIGIHTNFFELRGNSLNATIVASKIHKEFNIKVPLLEMFKEPTIAGLAKYLKKTDQGNYGAIEPVEKKEFYQLSSAQKRLYILQQMELKSTSYNMPGIIYLNTEFDLHKLEETFKEIIKRHDSLRTSFVLVNEVPVQKIHDHVELAIKYYEYYSPGKLEHRGKLIESSSEIEEIIEGFIQPFDLSKKPLFRVGLILMPRNNILLLDLHHIISDGISNQVLEEEFDELHNGDDLPALPLQYKDYTEWQNSTKQREQLKEQEKYWLGIFTGEFPVLDLPTDYPRPAVQSFEGNFVNFELYENQTKGIRNIMSETGCTLYMVILSIYTILLSKLSGQEDIIIGTPIAARRHPGLERIIGMFVNTLAMRHFPSGASTYKAFLEKVKEQTLEAYENQEYQFEDLVDNISITRDISRNPIFDVIFNLLDPEEGKDYFSEVDKDSHYDFEYKSKASKFDLTLRALDGGEKLLFNLEYSVRLFKQETSERIIGYFKQIVNEIISNPDIKLADIEIIPKDAREEQLNYFNEDLRETIGIEPIQVKLAAGFQKYRHRTAIQYGTLQVTYEELERRAACISKKILDANIERGSFIGIYLVDKIDIISSMIGILNAGCVFAPLDTALPVKRIEQMLRTANIRTVFTDGSSEKILFARQEADPGPDIENIFLIDDSTAKPGKLTGFDYKPLGIDYHRNDKVYLYFTSGTTGIPNAIVGKNESLVQFIQWEIDTFGVDKGYRISQLAAVGFDAFLRNLFTPLLAGGTVCIPESRELVMDGPGLTDWLDTNRIHLVHCVPSVFYLVINAENLRNKRFRQLKYVLMSGEQINPSQLKKWSDTFGERIQLVNCYGATETTVVKTFHLIGPKDRQEVQKDRIPAGLPMRGARALVLDRNMKICQQGIGGEIYIRTPYGSLGYLNNPELNAQRFIKNPFNTDDADIIYKTGDLGRKLENGEIEILGRVDRQVKIRGVRIELENIESCLLKHHKIDGSVVMNRTDENGEPYLCAYIVNKKQELRKTNVAATSPREPILNLNHLPFPDRSLVNYEKYSQYIGQSLIKNSISMLGSRGCPFKCAYCHRIWPKKHITRSAENIFQELKLYYSIGYRRFVFLDDVFNLDVKNTTRLFHFIIDNQLAVQLCLNLRGDILTYEYIDLMVKAGVIRMAFALETASPRLQKLIRKHLNLKRFKENMEYICQKYPQVILEINTMHGFPTETEEEARSTLEFIKALTHESCFKIPGLNEKIKRIFPGGISAKNALRVLLLDVTQFFSSEVGNILYDMVEAPLGLMYLMAHLNREYREKIHGKIAKSRIDFDSFPELKTLLQEFKPDIIGIRALTYFKEFFHKTAAMIRHWDCGVPIIAGGPYASSDYEAILQDRHIDLAVIGEGEQTISELIGAMLKNNGKLPARAVLEKIPGIAFASEGSKKVLDQAKAGTPATPSELRAFLAVQMPEYMVPGYFIPIETVPLTPNGKIAWRELPDPGTRIEGSFMEPADETEKKLAAIWADVLKVEKELIGRDSNFFELGGHSLKATILTSKMHKEMNIKVPLVEIFKKQTLSGLCQYIKSVKPDKHVAIDPVEKKDYYRLSSAQKRLYILQQMELESIGYNMPGTIYLDKDLGIARLENTFKELIKRHESLRTSFHMVDDQPVQKVHDEVEFKIEYYETGKRQKAKGNKEELMPHAYCLMPESLIKNFICPFNLSQAPLLRIGLINTRENDILLVDMHHIISDGISHEVLKEEFQAIYNGENLSELRLQYRDYAEWQTSEKEKIKIKKQEEYWLKEFSDELPVLNLMTDYPRPVMQSFEGNSVDFTLNETETRMIRKITAETGTTLFMVLLSIYTILLSKLSGQQDIILGTPIAARRHAELQRIIGMFVNILALRNFPAGDKAFKKFLGEVKVRTLEAFENQEYQFEDLVDRLSIERDTSRNPIFDVVFVLLNQAESTKESIDPVGKDKYIHEKKTVKFDINLTAIEFRENILFKLEYCSKLFKAHTIERYINYFKRVIHSILANPAQEIAQIEMITEGEKERILYKLNDTDIGYPKDKTLHELFDRQAEETPDNSAVIDKETRLTYKELERRANQLAKELRIRGVEEDTIAALLLDRSADMIVGILAILKSGGAYLPIGTDYPAERQKHMLEDSKTEILLTTTTEKNKIKRIGIDIDRVYIDNTQVYKKTNTAVKNINKPSSLAYIIYTSGTTGKPKGSMIEHKNVVRLMMNENFLFDFSSRDVWTLFHSYCFDFSVWEMYGALLYGAQLVIIAEMDAKDPERYLEILRREGVTVVNQTPTSFYNLSNLEASNPRSQLRVRYVIFGGESLSPGKLKPWKDKYPFTKLVNMYGITETTVHVTYKEITLKDIQRNISNIGKPIPTISVYVMDKNLNLLPIGVPGELCVGGDGVCRGYLYRKKLTREKFVENPHKQGERLYKSGDLGRYLENGELEYLGRIDEQVKIRGYRIELAEIERQLQTHASIKEVVVLAVSDKEGGKSLIAFFLPDKSVDIIDLREHLANVLPAYMIPAYFVRIENIPLTPNGKLDRKLLLTHEITSGSQLAAPRNEMEERLARIWADTLGQEQVGINDNYFQIGGDSIKAIQLLSAINKQLNINLKIPDIFANQTIEELARVIRRGEGIKPDKYLEEALIEINELKNKILEENQLAGDIEDIYPMSDIEKGMLFHSLKSSHQAMYHDQFVYPLNCHHFSIERFKKAVSLLVEKHPILRTSFNMDDFDEPLQIVHKKVPAEVRHYDISGHEQPEQQKYIEAVIKEDRFIPYKVSVPPLWRMLVFQMSKNNVCLVWSFHHAILDGWSNASFMTELSHTYLKLKSNPQFVPGKLKMSYKEFIIAERAEKKRATAVDFWRNELDGCKRVDFSGLGSDGEYQKVKHLNYNFDPVFYASLKAAARKHHTSIKNLCFGAYLFMLNMLSYDNEVVAGIISNNRPEGEDSEKVLGCFLNTVPFRIKIPWDIKWSDYIKIVEEKLVHLKSYEKLPFWEIVRVIEEKTYNKNPLFDTIFNYVDFHVYQQVDDDILNSFSPGGAGSLFPIEGYENTNTLFDFNVSTTFEEFHIAILYSSSLISNENVRRLFNWFKLILTNIVYKTERYIKRGEIITVEEKRLLLYEFNNTKVEYSKDKTIDSLYEEQVEKTPDNIALVFEGIQLSYRILNLKANQLARVIKERGVTSDTVVGIIVNPSLEMMIGILGIIKSGGAYLPIDIDFPEKRVKKILENSGIKLLLTQSSCKDSYSSSQPVIDLFEKRLYSGSGGNISKFSRPTDLAYVIYTSGSTGEPKGVMIEHCMVVNFILGIKNKIKFKSTDSILSLTTISFDIFVLETLLPLTAGSKVVMGSKKAQKDPDTISAIILQEKITVFQVTPSRLQLILAYEASMKSLSLLDYLLVGGESLPDALLNLLNQCIRGRIFNLYGPTETTIWSTIKELTGLNKVSIGTPIANTRIYILNSNQALQPIGIPGELYISGEGLSRGYLGQADLTREKFVPTPFEEDQKMYRTGDLARWMPDGSVEFLGRIDQQVKIRGFRIELGEIETQLLKHDGIKEAVVIARQDEPGQKYLCAYIVGVEAWGEVNKDVELKEYLSRSLPDYMIPSYFVELEEIPLTPNGKVNKRALPEPEIVAGDDYIAPTNNIEKELLQTWSDVLNLNKEVISINANFIELGGHSLLAMNLISKIQKKFGVKVPLEKIFKRFTIKRLGEFITQAAKDEFARIEPTEKKDYYQLSSAQKRVYIEQQMDLNNINYNMPLAVILENDLNKMKLEQTFQGLINRNESFRTSFEMVEREPVQRIRLQVLFKIEYHEAENEKAVRRTVQNFIRPFDLSKAPLIRVGLIRNREKQHEQVLMIDMHHIISDGFSLTILIKEFVGLYENARLPVLMLQYKDYSEWQNQLLASGLLQKHSEYWLNRFRGEIPELHLPGDDSPHPECIEGNKYVFQLSGELSREIRHLALITETTLYMILLAAYNILMAKYTAQEDIVVGVPVFGRDHGDLQNIIGMFVNLLPMRNQPHGEKMFTDFLKEVKENALQAYENQDYQFEQLAWELSRKNPGRQLEITTVLVSENVAALPGDTRLRPTHQLNVKPYTITNNISKFDITLTMAGDEKQDEILLDFEYKTGLFNKQTIEGMATHLGMILNTVTVNPQVKISDIDMLSEEEEIRLITSIERDEPGTYVIHGQREVPINDEINAEFDF